jgi:hypothetical protein
MLDLAACRPERNPFVRMRFHAGECVLILGRTTYGVGALELAVWQRCDGRTTIREIADALRERTLGEPSSEEGVAAIVEREVECGLLTRRGL